MSEGTSVVSDRWGTSAGPRAVRERPQYASRLRLPAAAEDRRNCSQVSPRAGRLPSGRGPNADRPFDEPVTSTARRVAAATWMMSSTTGALTKKMAGYHQRIPRGGDRGHRNAARSSLAAGEPRHGPSRPGAVDLQPARQPTHPIAVSHPRHHRRGHPVAALGLQTLAHQAVLGCRRDPCSVHAGFRDLDSKLHAVVSHSDRIALCRLRLADPRPPDGSAP